MSPAYSAPTDTVAGLGSSREGEKEGMVGEEYRGGQNKRDHFAFFPNI